MTWHFATSFKYEQVYPICFLSGFPKRLGQVTVTYWVYLDFFFRWGPIFFDDIDSNDPKSRKIAGFVLF